VQKCDQIVSELLNTESDLLQIFYSNFLRCFGMPANSISFGVLSNKVGIKILMKHSDSPLIQKALLMGAAGFLFNRYDGEDKDILVQEFNFFKIKHSLQTMQPNEWRFGGIRPLNSPVNRLKQFFIFLPYLPDIYKLCVSSKKPEEILQK
ncbi:MAG: DUF2851 family protein, partial [Bacteroidota bacterium]